MNDRVSLSGVSTGTWPLDRDVALCAEVGVTKVGVPMAKLDALGTDDAAAQLRDAGVGVSSVLAQQAFPLADPDRWDQCRGELRRAVDSAAMLDAGCLYLTTGPPGVGVLTDEACTRFASAIAPVLDYAAGAGVAIALEHNQALRRDIGFIHTLRDMVEFADEIEVGVCVELNNCWIERDLPGIFRQGVERFRVVQVSDFAIGTLQTPDRRVPGDGDIPLERVIGLLLECGYVGAFELEIVGPYIDAEGVGAASRRGLEWLGGTLDRLGA